MKGSRVLAVVLVSALGVTGIVRAQAAALPNLDTPSPTRPEPDIQADFRAGKHVSPRDYGVGNVNILQIPAAAFVPFNGTWTHDDKGYFSTTGSNFNAHGWAPLQLPSGANIQYVDVYYNDTDGDYDLSAKILAASGSGPSADLVPIGDIASSSGSSGKGYASSPSFAYTVNNDVQYNGGSQLIVQVTLPSSSLGFKAVDIWWTRQIAPAPATATFGDVPTNHPYFRVIEALAASGITSGCGGNNFCPNGTVTRQEVAKFMVRALGLYWNDYNLGPF
ncbi:MAG TPA: S-layer homology domain-containing protein [Thermoanaerobaculia bacterium]|jgi:hypothetical protein